MHSTPGYAEKIKIITLNCWGVFFKPWTVQKDVRIEAIAEMLRKCDCDIIFLQEVWVQNDFEKIKTALSSTHPYSVKFYAQVILLIFKLFPPAILLPKFETDWPAGKSMGYASTVTPAGFRLNLYNTHTHARYKLKHEDDPVEGHRLTQAIELMEFVRASAGSADAIFIAGDLNLEPYTTAIRLLKRSLGLKDAWLDQTARHPVTNLELMEFEGATCERADCPYANKKWTKHYGNGVRLDYVFYRPGVVENGLSSVTIECEHCQVKMSEVPSNPGLFYSDHALVTGEFIIRRHENPVPEENPPVNSEEPLETLLIEADNVIKKQVQMENKKKLIYLVIAPILIVAFLVFGTAVPVCHPAYKFFSSLVLMLAGAGNFALIWGNAIGRPCIMSSLRNAKSIIWNQLAEFINQPKNY
ncbi:unnamed protein product [Hymenolepis diminuta]|uniref:sphingomyelin phosphodiesterase n=1 Tax=Hymenolepis diminuta TaxID=6216 RepID=A0A158QCR7_HYMDI|nr:unnamed protein product [Hymenolepis diminuta]